MCKYGICRPLLVNFHCWSSTYFLASISAWTKFFQSHFSVTMNSLYTFTCKRARVHCVLGQESLLEKCSLYNTYLINIVFSVSSSVLAGLYYFLYHKSEWSLYVVFVLPSFHSTRSWYDINGTWVLVYYIYTFTIKTIISTKVVLFLRDRIVACKKSAWMSCFGSCR